MLSASISSALTRPVPALLPFLSCATTTAILRLEMPLLLSFSPAFLAFLCVIPRRSFKDSRKKFRHFLRLLTLEHIKNTAVTEILSNGGVIVLLCIDLS